MVISRKQLILSPLLLLFLSSCAQKNTVSILCEPTSSDSNSKNIVINDTETSQISPTDLLPEPVEPEKCIDQELQALKKTGSWDSGKEDEKQDTISYDFPITMNKQVEMYLDLFQHRQQKYFKLWLERSGKYLPLMQSELKKAGLPTDLAYLALIESGYNPRACSPAKATGLWQFIRGTGRDYNLRIDRYVDERRDAEKSTKAAVSLLKDLYGQFNDWYLAVAAYNAGAGKIGSGLRRYNVSNFWQLAEKKYLRLETVRYVPKLIAAIIIAKEPEKYGFKDIKYMNPLQYDTIEVGPGMSLKALALVTNSSEKEILSLNQELKTEKTPLNQSHYQARIPKDTKQLAEKNLPRLRSIVRTGYKTHIKQRGETLSAICRRYDINKTTLLKVNNLRNGTLENGQRLRIPYSSIDYTLLPTQSTSIASAAQDGLILYTIKNGDSISKIAHQFHVPPSMIVAWNGLKNVNAIRAGQKLSLYIVKDSEQIPMIAAATNKIIVPPTPTADIYSSPVSRQVSNNNIIVLTDENKKKVLHSSVNSTSKISNYEVKQGDTLWKISRKFKISMRQIKKWNNLDSNLIHPGSILKLNDV